jgi:hypothetical protein
LKMGSCELFVQATSNCHPPDLRLSSSYDYRHEAPVPSKVET